MGRGVIDITGKRFGKLTVVSFDHMIRTRSYWRCKCDCGNDRVVALDHLKCGDTTDCGCERKHISHWQKHGMYKSRLYTIWSLMKERCLNPKRKEYPIYGGRNITVCPEWLKFENFMEWSVKNGYSDELTIDRINNNGNYCPENCRWISKKEQSNNRRTNRLITFNGQTKTITQWANDNGLPYYILKNRLDKSGWPFERAISEPLNLRYSNKKKIGDDKSG